MWCVCRGEMNAAGAGGGGVGTGAGGDEGEGNNVFEPHPDHLPTMDEWRRLLKRIRRKQKRYGAYESLLVHVLEKWNSVSKSQVHGLMLAIDKAYGKKTEMSYPI